MIPAIRQEEHRPEQGHGLLAIPHLCGVSSVNRRRRALVVIRAFFDESEQGDICVVAGWVTDYETWGRFSDDWRSTLDAEPQIEYLRLHEAKTNPPSGQFQGWTLDVVEAKLAALADVICRHAMYGMAVGLRLSTHNYVFSKAAVNRKVLRSVLKVTEPYQSCVAAAIAMVMHRHLESEQKGQVLEFVFDRNSLLNGILETYDLNKPRFSAEFAERLGSITQADDKKVGALQAADFLAGEITSMVGSGHAIGHLKRFVTAHRVFSVPAYCDSFHKLPQYVEMFNELWQALQFWRRMERLVDEMESRRDDGG